MFKSPFVWALVTAGAMAMGCDREDDTTTPKTPPAPAQPTPQATPGGTGVNVKVNGTGTGAAAPKIDVTATTQPGGAGVNVNVDTAGVNAAVSTKAQELMDQVAQYMKDKKWSDAESALKQLEAMKAQLPVEWQKKIDALRASLTSAKAAGGDIKAPELPGMTK